MTFTLVVITTILAYLTFIAYVIVAPWWTTRAGRATFALFTALIIATTWFLAEAILGQLPAWGESAVIGILAAALAFNLGTITYKQWHFRGKDRP
ncbi:hypothetical protein GCM10022377_10340 [Zhihengliuella alba]|uniref:Holin n=1 Tax=Zhihengliuella alba TaxID=547018 RepID=A0ABP7D4S5_9MICC